MNWQAADSNSSAHEIKDEPQSGDGCLQLVPIYVIVILTRQNRYFAGMGSRSDGKAQIALKRN
ncbi:MAG: hypothetical protein NC548_01835 [Lachnospiraceae bacterium]|nr:hypothetical protein [Lachnospiraceae bacterium]